MGEETSAAVGIISGNNINGKILRTISAKNGGGKNSVSFLA